MKYICKIVDDDLNRTWAQIKWEGDEAHYKAHTASRGGTSCRGGQLQRGSIGKRNHFVRVEKMGLRAALYPQN